MMAEHGMEGKQAERFYDLYEKGDAETALKEFPEFSSFATEAQKRAAVVPAEGAEIPEPASGPMATSGTAMERTAPPAEAGTPPETEEYIRLRKMANKVQLAGDPAAAARLNELIKTNPEIANLFKPEDNADWSRLEPILTRMSDLMKRIEKDGDPNAAQELTDYIKANPEALEGFPRWPVEPGTAGKEKPAAAPTEPVRPTAPMDTTGGTMEAAVKPAEAEAAPVEVAPTDEAPPEAGKVDPLQAAKDFKTKFGSRQGPPDVGIEQPAKVWMPPSKRSRTYDMERAVEHGDIDTMILASGGWDRKSDIFKNFEKEEVDRLFRYMRSKKNFPNVKGPDVMFRDFKESYPHLMPWESEADWIAAMLSGEHKKALKSDKVFEDLEAQHDYNLKEAKREGYSPEDVAAAEAELERQIAAEELAGRSAKPGDYDIDAGWTGTEEGALRASAPKPNKLNARLDELATEYPDIDREKAATVLRAFPDAGNNHIAAMSADPEMFSQVARGNLAASERLQLLRKATDAGAQQGLPGMEGGAGKLFKVGETGDDLMERLKIKSDLLKGRMSKDDYNAQYAGKYGEWGSPEWSDNIDYFRDIRRKEGGIELFRVGELSDAEEDAVWRLR